MFAVLGPTAAHARRSIAALGSALALAACQTFSPDGGLSVASDVAGKELRKDVVFIQTEDDASAVRARVRHMIGRTLTAEAAVQIALLNNRGLQAAYNELGIAEAVTVRQSLPPNPQFRSLRMSGSVETEIERQIVGRYSCARHAAGALGNRRGPLPPGATGRRTGNVARRRRSAARHSTAPSPHTSWSICSTQAESAAATSAQLANRLGETGAHEQARPSARTGLSCRRHHPACDARVSARHANASDLIRSLGLWGAISISRCRSRCRRCRSARSRLPQVEQEAVSRRVDLQIARIELETLAKSYGLTEATRFVNVLEAGYADKVTNDKETASTPRSRIHGDLRGAALRFRRDARCARPSRPTCRRSIGWPRRRSMCAREARDAYRSYRVELRHRRALPARGAAAAQDHLRRNDAALRRHAGRRVFAADRSAAADCGKCRRRRCAPRFLARQHRSCRRDSRRRRLATASDRAPSANVDLAGRGRPLNDEENDHDFTAQSHRRLGHSRRRGRGQRPCSGRRHSGGASSQPPRAMQPPLASVERAGLSAGRHAQRLDLAVADERRLEGIPPRRRAGGARNRPGHEGASVGLQRPIAGADHRMRRGRQSPHLRHQQAARAHHRALARHAGAERHGRRRRPDPAAYQARARPSSTSSRSGKAAPSCITRMPTRWCRWRWA